MARSTGTRNGLTPGVERSDDLFAPRDVCPYNEAEQQFSRHVQERLDKLLKGDVNCLALLRRYHQDPGRLGVPVPKHGLDGRDLRLPMIEEVLTRVLMFLQSGMPGGPIAQEASEGRLIERQLHTTRFPHIVIERVDSYEAASGVPIETEWVLKRVQNQHAATRINRMLDVANLGFELFRAAR